MSNQDRRRHDVPEYLKPELGATVIYQSRTGNYRLAAVVSATSDSLYRPGVEEGNVPDLSSDTHVHLTVFTPGIAGRRNSTTTADQEAELTARSTPAGGSYQEWDIPYNPGEAVVPGAWSWPR